MLTRLLGAPEQTEGSHREQLSAWYPEAIRADRGARAGATAQAPAPPGQPDPRPVSLAWAALASCDALRRVLPLLVTDLVACFVVPYGPPVP